MGVQLNDESRPSRHLRDYSCLPEQTGTGRIWGSFRHEEVPLQRRAEIGYQAIRDAGGRFSCIPDAYLTSIC